MHAATKAPQQTPETPKRVHRPLTDLVKIHGWDKIRRALDNLAQYRESLKKKPE